jgi:glycosyltransferase involved in cell wall biosynthesis
MSDEARPLFSVVIPTYNHGKYLGRALQSVLDQTYADWEAIVIDNHSTDDTDDVMSRFIDSRIIYMKIHNNGVIAVSRNAGLRAANGEWIAFLDSDDWWTSDKLKACFDAIDINIDLLFHDLGIVSNHSLPFSKKSLKGRLLIRPVLIDLLAGGNVIPNSSAVVRKSLLLKINGIDESRSLIGAEDFNTWLRIAQFSDQFYYIPHLLGFYLSHSQNISKKNMSLPSRKAISDFVDILTNEQRLRLEARLRYISGRFNYLAHNNKLAKLDLLFSLKHASLIIKIKSLFMLIFLFVFR